MKKREFCRNNISNIILSAINVVYFVIGCCIWLSYFCEVKETLEQWGHDAALGGTGMILMFLHLSIAVSFVLFVPFAVVARTKTNSSRRFYRFNTYTYFLITIANVTTILLIETIVDKMKAIVI